MKIQTKIIVILALITSTQTLAQEKNKTIVPIEVIDSLKQEFSEAKEVEWQRIGRDLFEANFQDQKDKKTVLFDDLGRWQKIATEVKMNKLPAVIQKHIKANYPSMQFIASNRVQSRTASSFEIELRNNAEQIWIITYSETGDFISKNEYVPEFEYED